MDRVSHQTRHETKLMIFFYGFVKKALDLFGYTVCHNIAKDLFGHKVCH